MPAIRPDEISDCVSLSDKLRTADVGLVSKDGAIDSCLSAVVDEPSPHEHGIGSLSTQHNLFAGADELGNTSTCSRAVVSREQLKAVRVAIFR